MRLDKMLSECGVASRTESAKAARAGRITVNGVPVKRSDVAVDPARDTVVYGGVPVRYRKFVYVMLNKPEGYVSATEDGKDPTVTELLPAEYRRMGVFPCGRLDKNTLGLMLLTNDGALSHRLLAPKSRVAKSYAFRTRQPLTEANVIALETGVDIGGYVTQPCRIALQTADEGIITITEGKYHQIKRMMEAIENKIIYLERCTFGPLTLDPALERGQWRELTDGELAALLET